MTITDEQRHEFRERGYLVLPGLIAPPLLEQVAARAAEILAGGEGVVSRVSGSERRVLQKVAGLSRTDPVFGELAHYGPLVDAVEGLLGEPALIFRDVMVVKPAREGAEFHWHQDSAYWDIEPRSLISAWVALGDVPEGSGCLRFVPGTHLAEVEHDLPLGETRRLPRPLARLLRRLVSLAGTGDNPGGAGGNRVLYALKQLVLGSATKALPFLGNLGEYSVGQVEIDRLGIPPVSVPASAGTVVLFHSLLLHSSNPNTSDADRPAPIVSYMGESFRFTGRGEASFDVARRSSD